MENGKQMYCSPSLIFFGLLEFIFLYTLVISNKFWLLNDMHDTVTERDIVEYLYTMWCMNIYTPCHGIMYVHYIYIYTYLDKYMFLDVFSYISQTPNFETCPLVATLEALPLCNTQGKSDLCCKGARMYPQFWRVRQDEFQHWTSKVRLDAAIFKEPYRDSFLDRRNRFIKSYSSFPFLSVLKLPWHALLMLIHWQPVVRSARCERLLPAL